MSVVVKSETCQRALRFWDAQISHSVTCDVSLGFICCLRVLDLSVMQRMECVRSESRNERDGGSERKWRSQRAVIRHASCRVDSDPVLSQSSHNSLIDAAGNRLGDRATRRGDLPDHATERDPARRVIISTYRVKDLIKRQLNEATTILITPGCCLLPSLILHRVDFSSPFDFRRIPRLHLNGHFFYFITSRDGH